MSKFIKYSVNFTVPKDQVEHQTTLDSIKIFDAAVKVVSRKLVERNKEDKWHIGWQNLGWETIPSVDYDKVEELEAKIEELKDEIRAFHEDEAGADL